MPWPTQRKFDPVGTVGTTSNAMANLENIARRRRFEEAMMAQQPGAPVPQAAMAAMPAQAAAVGQQQMAQRVAQRKQEFLTGIGPASVAVQQGQPYEELIPEGFGQQYPEQMTTWVGQAEDTKLKRASTRAALLTDSITRNYQVSETLSGVGSAEEWDRAVNHLAELGYDASQYLGKYSPSVRDRMVEEADRARELLTNKLADEKEQLGPFAKFWDNLNARREVPLTYEEAKEQWMDMKKSEAARTEIQVGAGERAAYTEAAKLAVRRVYDTHKTAKSASKTLTSINNARDLVAQGAVTGAGAEIYNKFAKIMDQVGFDVGEQRLTSSEALQGVLNMMAAGELKVTFGGQNITDSEREFLLRSMGKQTTVQGALDVLLGFYEDKSIGIIEDHNAAAGNPRLQEFLFEDLTVGIPEPKEAAKVRRSQSIGGISAAQAGRGGIVEYKGKQYRSDGSYLTPIEE